MGFIRLEFSFDSENQLSLYLPPKISKWKVRSDLSVGGILVLESENREFEQITEFIDSIISKKHHIDKIVIWDFMDREVQINGELSQGQIQWLAKVNAAYCWTVL